MTPLPPGPWPCILADPPWKFRTYSEKGNGRGAVQHYPVMKLQDIIDLPVRAAAAPSAWLFLWTTGPHLQQSFRVLEAWGFRYSSMAFTWIKTNPKAPVLFLDGKSFHMGPGHTTRKNAEYCLLGRRGSPKRLSKSVRELIIAPRREHSRKPDEAYDRIREFCAGPRLELFARQERPGWTAWGNETAKFNAPAEAPAPPAPDPAPIARCVATMEMFTSRGGHDDESGQEVAGGADGAAADGGAREAAAAGV